MIEATLTLPPSLQLTILEFARSELSAGRVDLEARLAQAATTAEDLATENERQATQFESQFHAFELLQAEKSTLEGCFSVVGVSRSIPRFFCQIP